MAGKEKTILQLDGEINLKADKAKSQMNELKSLLDDFKAKTIDIKAQTRSARMSIQNLGDFISRTFSKENTVKLNTADAQAKADKLASTLRSFKDNNKITISLDSKGVSSQLQSIRNDLNFISGRHTISLNATTAQVKSQLAGLSKDINNIKNVSFTINVKNNADLKGINTFTKDMSKLAGLKSDITFGITVKSVQNSLDRVRQVSNVLANLKNNNFIQFTESGLNPILGKLKNMELYLRSIKQNSKIKIEASGAKDLPKLKVEADQSDLFAVEKRLAIITNQIRRINRMTLKVNTRYNNRSGGGGGSRGGSSDGTVGGDRWYNSSDATQFIHFLGRSSKGLGSFGEALADVLAKGNAAGGSLSKLTGTASIAAATIGGMLAAGNLLIGAINNLASALGSIVQLIATALKPGFELMAQRDTTMLTTKAALKTSATVNGRAVTNEEATAESAYLFSRAMQEAAKTVLNLNDILTAQQGVLPMLLNKGMTPKQAQDVIFGVAGVAKTGRLAPNQVLQETRDLAQGSITARTSQVANILGITNQDLAKFKGDVDALYDYLMQKFQEYTKVMEEYANTPVGAIEQLQETWGIAAMAIVDQYGPLIVETAHAITKSLGEFDEQGNFKLSDWLKELADGLQEIVVYAASCADAILNFLQILVGGEDPIETIINLIKDMLGALTMLVGTVLGVGAVFKLFWVGIKVGISILEALTKAALGVGQAFFAMFAAMAGNPAEALNWAKTANATLAEAGQAVLNATDLEGQWKGTISSGWTSGKGNKDFDTFLNRQGDITSKVISLITKAKSADTPKGRDVLGMRGNAQNKEDEKARKKAIKDAQKALQEHLKGLKEALKDHIEELKEALAKNKLAFDQGFMTIKDYYTQKAAIEAEEARLRLEEAQAEKSAILATPYENQADQLKALHSVEREIRSNTRALNKGIKAQQEVERNSLKMARAMEIIANTSMSHNITELTPTQNGQQVSGGGNATTVQLQLEGWASKKGIEPWIADEVLNQAQKYGPEWAEKYAKLALAMIMQESGGNQGAISGAGAIGLMQLMPDTARSLGVNPWDWKQNITGGLKYIDQLRNTFGWDTSKIIAGYNAGPGAVQAYGGVPPYRETQNHVGIVSGYYNEINNFAVSASNASKQLDNVANSAANASALFEGAKDVKLGADGKILGYVPVEKYSRGGIDTRYSDFEEYGMSGGVDSQIAGLQKSSIYAINALARAYWERTGEKITWTSFTGDRTGGYNPHEKSPNGHFYGWKADAKASAHAILIELMNALQIGGSWENHHFDISFGRGNAYYNPNEMTNTRTGEGWLNSFNASKGVSSGNIVDIKNKVNQSMSDIDIAYKENVDRLLNGDAQGIIDALKKAVPDETETGNTYYNDALNQLETFSNLISEAGSRITGNVTAGFRKLVIEFYKNIISAKKDPNLTKAYTDKFITSLLDYRKQAAMTMLNFNLEEIKYRGEAVGNEILMGRYNFGDMLTKYNKYVSEVDPNNLFSPANQIKQLEALYREYEAKGFLQDAVEIRNALEKVYKELQDVIKGWIDKGIEYIEKQKSIFEADSRFTNTQREFGNREFQAHQASFEYARRTELGAMIEQRLNLISTSLEAYNKRISEIKQREKEINDLYSLRKTLGYDTKELEKEKVDLDKESKFIESEIGRLNHPKSTLETMKRANDLEREKLDLLRKEPEYWRDIRDAANQALDDGLVTFLTDGINEAESLGEALRNLAITFLKEIQKVSAKWMVKSLMNKIVGQFNFRSPAEITADNSSLMVTAIDNQTVQVTSKLTEIAAILNGKSLYGMPSSSVGYTFSTGVSMSDKTINGIPVDDIISGSSIDKSKTITFGSLDSEQFATSFKSSLDEFKLSNTELINANMANTAATTADTAVEQASVSLDTAAKITDQESNALTAENNVQLANVSAQLSSVTVGSAHASGGYITGPGTGTSDSIPARLSAGEYVIKAEAVKRMGVNYLNAINNGNFTKIKTGVHHYAQGGLVSDLAQEQTARGISNFGKDISNNISNTANISVALVRDEQEGMKQLLRSPEGQRIMLDFSRRYASVTSRF